MVRGNMLRWGWAVVGVAMSLAGCTCGEPQVDCTDTTISFETPTAGQTVDSPFEVTFSVKAPDGAAFAIDAATLKVGTQTLDATSVSGNRATFSGLTAVAGEVTLTPTIAEGSCSKTGAPISITVRDTCSTPQVTAVEFPQDVAPLGVLNRTELPDGTNLVVRVTASCVAEGVQVRVMRGGTVVGPLTAFVNGVATVTTTLPDSENSRYDLFAELVRDGQPVNTATSNPAAAASIQVSRSLPACALTTTGSFGPMADADSSTAGFQMRVTGTMAIGTTGSLGITGQTPVAVAPSMTGDVSADFTIPMSGSFTATLQCTDAAGNTNQATSMFSVDFDPPTVSITSPANVDGGATMQVTSSPLTVTVATNAEDGSTVTVLRNGAAQGSAMVTGGSATVPVSFGTDGTFTIEVRVTDTAGNTSTASVSVVVVLDGCGAAFTRPASCPALITPAQLQNGLYTFQTTSKAQCAAQQATLIQREVLSDGGIGASVQAGTASLSSAGVASFPGVSLPSGDYLFVGQVANAGGDAGVSEATCRVTVDLDGPVINSPVVPTGQTAAIINVVQDSQANTCGVQRLLSFSGRVPQGGRVDVCTTQATNPCAVGADGGALMRPTSVECGAGWYVLQQGVVSPLSGFTFPDGNYEVKVVVVGGGAATAPASPAVPVFVDSVRPCVSGLSRVLPQDQNADSRLNIAELAGGQPQVRFALGCGDTETSLAATGGVVVRDITAGAAGATRASSSTFSNGNFTTSLTGSYATELELNFFIELTDRAGNRNTFVASGDPGSFQFRVDPVAPACSITAPAATLLGLSQVPGGNLDVIVGTSSDVGTNGVSVTMTGQQSRSLTPSLGQVQTTYALTGDNTYSIGATCTDQSGNAATASGRTTRVDLVAPTCNITAPANNATSTINQVTTTVQVTGVSNGDTVTITSSASGISSNLLTVSGTTATGDVVYPNGAQTVSASINDSAGNPCVAPSGGARQVQLTVNSQSCSLAFSSSGPVVTLSTGSWINRASANNPTGTSPASVNIGAVTADCGAGKNVYLYQGPPQVLPTSTPQVTDSSGAVSFNGVGVSDSQLWTMSIDNGAGLLTHRSFTVSFAVPTVASIGLQRSALVPSVIAVAPNAALTFGAASGNRRVETATATDMVFGDLDPNSSGAQIQLTLGAIDGARAGGNNAMLEVLEGSTLLTALPINVDATPFIATLPRMTLSHRTDETTTTLVIRVTSPAGNVFSSTHSAQVDVIAPEAPSVTQTLSSARAATVGLSWAPVYDDGVAAPSGGLAGGSPVAGYDIRWTTSSVLNANSMATETEYFGSTAVSDGITAWSGAVINKALSVPPINTYFIAVRARDEVGNYSSFQAPTGLANPWTTSVITAPVASSSFGASLIAEDLFGDGARELVVTATGRGGVGSVYVYGSSLLGASQTGCPAGCQELVPSDTGAGLFGSDISVGNVGAVGTEAKPDLLIAQQTTVTPFGGRVTLYFGSAAATLSAADSIEFRGDGTNRIGQSAAVIRDITGDGRDEIAIAEPLFASNRGRVVIYRGRDRADWLTLRTATDAVTMVPYIPVSAANADYVIDGPLPLLSTGNSFGQNRRGLVSVNDLDGDTFPDLGIPTSRGTIGKYRVYGSAAIKGSSSSTPLDGTSSYRLELTETPTTDASFTAGLGTMVIANRNFVGASGPDLLVSFPGAPGGGELYVYDGVLAPSTPTINPVRAYRLTGPLTFGQAVTTNDLNGDGFSDVYAATNLSSGNVSYLLFQNGGAFEPGAVANAFWMARLEAITVTGNSSSRLGAASAIVDVTGDSNAELVLGDSTGGEVRIWR